jgi:hypothetical protein
MSHTVFLWKMLYTPNMSVSGGVGAGNATGTRGRLRDNFEKTGKNISPRRIGFEYLEIQIVVIKKRRERTEGIYSYVEALMP